MNQAFHTGIVGVQTHQYGIDILSDNIANINTVGFRGYQAEFSSLFENALQSTALSSPTHNTVGVGSALQATSMNQTTGTLMQSDKTTNLAIDGDGWFGIANPQGTFYTRSGIFSFDGSRNLVTPGGDFVLGTMGNNISNGILTQELDSLSLGNVTAQQALMMPDELTYPVNPTTRAQFYGNLGATDVPRLSSATLIDPEGNHNRLELRYAMSNPQPATGSSWDITATVTSNDGSTVYDTKSGTATFSEFGALTGFTLPSVNNNGATVSIDLGSGYDGVYATASEAAGSFSSSSDGIEGGELVGYDINQYADIIATFTNGHQSAVGKVAVYHFQNDQGLERISGTLFKESSNSGEPLFFTDADGNNVLGTTVRNSMLENSNIRFEVSLTELIIMQRAYDANAKSITTGDELIQKALQMDA